MPPAASLGGQASKRINNSIYRRLTGK